MRVRELDVSSDVATKDNVSLIVGRRGVGKSVLVRDLLHKRRQIAPFEEIVSPKRDTEWTDSVKRFNDRQTDVTRIAEKESKDFGRRTTNPCGTLVLDRCVGLCDPNWHENTDLQRLFTHNTNFHASLMVVMQYAMSIPRDLRMYIDFVFMFAEPNDGSRRRIYEQYVCPEFATFDEFCSILDEHTRDHGCLVVDLSASTSDVAFLQLRKSSSVFVSSAHQTKHRSCPHRDCSF